jgi:hypothetical protein
MNKTYLPIKFELKTLEDSGVFQGYANVFNVLDHDMDVVEKGAFSDTLAQHAAKNTKPKMLWQHDYKQIIGVWESMKEDDHGLHVTGRLAINTTLGKDAYELLKMGAIDSMSIGYMVPDKGATFKDGVRIIKQLDLWEVSIVTFPANDSAVVNNVKRQVENGEIPAPAVFERILRDVGLSANQAKAFMAKGYKGVDPREADLELLESIKTLSEKFKKGD